MHDNNHRVLLFDIDGTLLNPANEGLVCLRRALEDVYGITGPIEAYDMAGKTDWHIITDLMQAAGLDDETIKTKLLAAFSAYTRHIEITAKTLKMRPLPGVHALLENLADEPGYVLGLVTGNVREIVPFKLQAVGISPSLFTFGAFGSEHPDRNKLPPLALYRLGQQLGSALPTESALVIGDTPHDIACARHTGLRVLCVATGTYSREALEPHKPDYLLDDLSDTDAVMEILRNY